MSRSIPRHELITLIRWLLSFPESQVCRHLVILQLLSLMERHGDQWPGAFIDSIIQCDDLTALGFLKESEDQPATDTAG